MNIVIDDNVEQKVSPEIPQEIDIILIEESLENERTATELNYSLNYTLPMLRHIAGFYDLEYKRIKKQNIIDLIVDYEINQDNIYVVQERQRLWYYMDEIKENKYLSKYIISM